MKKLFQLLIAMMIVASIGLVGCSPEQGERENNRGTDTEEGVTTMTPEGGTDTNDGVGGDQDGETEGPKTNGGTNY